MTKPSDDRWLWANWPAPGNVHAGTSLRNGGISLSPFNDLNLGLHVGDDEKDVLNNRKILSQHLKLVSEPVWLEQTHSSNIISLDNHHKNISADSSYTTKQYNVCTIMTADCVPILFCNTAGSKVAAIHAGWRGICNGIIEKAVNVYSNPDAVLAWIGPCISSNHYEVGKEVYERCIAHKTSLKGAFIQINENHWRCGLVNMVKIILKNSGIRMIYDCELCTYTMNELLYSYRREGVTGRTASMIWME